MLSTPSQGLFLRLLHVANGQDLSINIADAGSNHPMTVVSSSTADIFWAKEQSLVQTQASDIAMPSNDTLTLGPVEKAVFQQAMYNQSKKKTPAMRRCDDCNVIFNSQIQAEMHYKGKKHARIMYLKRSRERKISSSRVTSYLANIAREDTGSPKNFVEESLMEAEYRNKESCTSTSPSSVIVGTSTTGPVLPMNYSSMPARCCIKYSNTNLGPIMRNNSPEPDIMSNPKDTSLEVNFSDEDRSTLKTKPDGAGRNERDLQNNQCNGPHIPDSGNEKLSPKLVEERTPSTDSGDDEKSEESVGPPQREPVILPDPLPSYIKKVERPAVLKESLRCNVCDIYVNSENQMRQHVNSLRHKNIEQGIPIPPKPGKEDKPKTRAEQFKCEVCRVTLNSDIQLLQHLSSQRHKNMLEGKPPKPRWTPYERAQQAILRSAAQLRLPFKTVQGTNQSILATPALAGSIPIPALPMVAQPTLQNAVLSAGAPTAHLKQTAFIGPNGSLYQTREIVYVGAGGSGYPGAYHQQQIGAATPILAQQPLHLQQPCDLTHLLNAAAAPIGVDQTSIGI